MYEERLEIPVDHPTVDAVSAIFQAPDGSARASAVLFAHGAGAPMDSPFLETVAGGLVERGFPVLRFDYPYQMRARADGRRRPPDRAPLLESAHRAALAALEDRADGRRLLLGGKSLGGRMSSHLAAQGETCAGLCFAGYPLHPPGKPDRLRSEHFAAIAQPVLFLQGTRDALCRLPLLRRELQRFGGVVTLALVEDADHDFKVPRSTGLSRADVLAGLVAEIDRWERETFPEA